MECLNEIGSSAMELIRSTKQIRAHAMLVQLANELPHVEQQQVQIERQVVLLVMDGLYLRQ